MIERKPRKNTRAWEVTRTHYEMNLMELCYFAALVDGLRVIAEASGVKPIPTREIKSGALIAYVQSKGVQIYKLQEGV